jgi:hypothetical protein
VTLRVGPSRCSSSHSEINEISRSSSSRPCGFWGKVENINKSNGIEVALPGLCWGLKMGLGVERVWRIGLGRVWRGFHQRG